MLTGVPTLTADYYEGTLHFDGGAQPNPGRGGGGYVLHDEAGYEVESCSIDIMTGYDKCTSNQAEYVGLLKGLEEARRQGMKRLLVKGDSQLVIKQMQGMYRVSSNNLIGLYQRAKRCEQEDFIKVEYEHIERCKNTAADELATEGVNREGNIECDLSDYTSMEDYY